MRRDERGFTLIELNVATLISGIILAAAVALVVVILRDTSYVEARTQAQSEVNVAFERLVVELREAETADLGGWYVNTEVREMTATKLVFTSDVASGFDGPELLTYEVTNCSAGECELVRTVVGRGGFTGGIADYAGGTTLQTTVVVNNVIPTTPTTPLFEGIDWTGGIRTETASCDSATASPCQFDAVDIDIQVGLRASSRPPQRFEEYVRIRNHG